MAALTYFRDSPYWSSVFVASWHVGTALVAIVFCILAIANARKKPGEAATWLLAAAGVWMLGHLTNLMFASVEDPMPDFVEGLMGFIMAIVISSIFMVPARIGAKCAELASCNTR